MATHVYNGPLGRLSDMSYDKGGQNLATYHYVTNDVGQRTQMTETVNGVTRVVAYTYDDLGRLIEETVDSGAHVISYTYDLMGNRLSSDDSQAGLTTYTYDVAGRLDYQTLGNVVTDFDYDDAGATIAQIELTNGVETGRTDYLYDVRGKLSQADVDGDGTFDLTYIYDANGALIGRSQGGVATSYLVDPQNPTGYSQVIEEWTSGNQDVSYVYGLGAISQSRGGTDSTYLTDGLGSVIALADSSGAVTDTYTYSAFGEVIASTGTTDNVIQFTGERYDPALGQYELRARRYDPITGRFTTVDPLQGTQPELLNLNIYANADPVNLTDPTGQFSIAGVLTAVGIGATVVSFAIPTYQFANSMKQLLDINDFVIAIRKGLNAGWMQLDEFLPMHLTAQVTATYLAQQATSAVFDLYRSVVDLTSFGQIYSFMEVAGDFGGWVWSTTVNEISPGVVENAGHREIGDATTFVSKSWYVINSTVKGARAGHHLIPKAALGKVDDIWKLFRARKAKYIGANIVNMSSKYHDELHSLMRNWTPAIAPVENMASVIGSFPGGAAGYLDELGEFYLAIQRQHPEKYDGIYDAFQSARKFIKPENLAGVT